MTITSSARKPSRAPLQPIHIFEIGQIVRFKNAFSSPFLASSYTVTRTLPPQGTSLQYRISAVGEGYERVTTQETLESVLEAPAIKNTLLHQTFGIRRGAPL